MSPPPTSIDGTDITGATIDGQEVQEITVDGDTMFRAALNGLLLDDFADGKLTNRDDFGTTPLNPSSLEPATSNTSVTTRPEYIDISNSNVNTSNSLVHSSSFNTAFVYAELPSFTGTHNVTLTGSGENVKFVLLGSGSSVVIDVNGEPAPNNGYRFQLNHSSQGFSSIQRIDNANPTQLSNGGNSPGLPLEGSFDDSGNFTLEMSPGTLSATDTTHNIDFIGIGFVNTTGETLTYSSLIVD